MSAACTPRAQPPATGASKVSLRSASLLVPSTCLPATVGDEILEVNGCALFGRCHLNASAVIKNLDGPVYRILLLRRESALSEMAVKPLTQFPVHLEQEALEEKYNRFTGVRTVTVRKSPLGLGIMIIEGKHTELGRGVFISDIQSGSPAEQSGLAVGDMILCVNQTDLICSDYDTAASLLKNADGLLSIVVAKPNKSCLKASLSHGPDSSLQRLSSSCGNNCLHTSNNNNNKLLDGLAATAAATPAPEAASSVSSFSRKHSESCPGPSPCCPVSVAVLRRCIPCPRPPPVCLRRVPRVRSPSHIVLSQLVRRLRYCARQAGTFACTANGRAVERGKC